MNCLFLGVLLACCSAVTPLHFYPLRDDPLSSPVQHRHWVKASDVFGNTMKFCGYRGVADWAGLEACKDRIAHHHWSDTPAHPGS